MKITLTKTGDPFQFTAQNESGAQTRMDASTSVGGTNTGLRPMEHLVAALAGCAAIDLLIILQKKRIEITDLEIDIFAERKEETPSAFRSIQLQFKVAGAAPESVYPVAGRVLEKYCSVAASLHPDISITHTVNEL